jgi:hypothetical protein
VKAFAIFDDWGEEDQVSTTSALLLQTAAKLISRLSFHRQIAIRTELSSEAGE